MRVINVYPCKIRSYNGICEGGYKNTIIVGKCRDGIAYSAKLGFPAANIKANEKIIKAVLKMNCTRACGDGYAVIGIRGDTTGTCVGGKGAYEWNIRNTDINKDIYDIELIMMKKVSSCAIREFDICRSPYIEIIAMDNDDFMTDDMAILESTAELKRSQWIDCARYEKYYYFIRNDGPDDISVTVEISPDKNIVYNEKNSYDIPAGNVCYITPQYAGRYLRIAYRNNGGLSPTKLVLWFQGK